jgi:hypothetical protein
MKRIFLVGLFALLSTIPAFKASAGEGDNPLANAPTQYSADMVITRKAVRPTSMPAPAPMHVYVDGNKRRTDRDIQGGIISILRGDVNKRYILTVSSKTYIEAPLTPGMLEPITASGKKMGIQEKVGTEEVNGELCDKYRLGSDTGKTPQTRQPGPVDSGRPRGFIWVGQSTHMIVKSDNSNYTVEWKNIKLGPPDASVFEVPADYKKAEQATPAPETPEESPSPTASPTGE